MIRGTTPFYTVEVRDCDLTEMTVYLTIRGISGRQAPHLLTLTNERLRMTADERGTVIAFRLTQEETLAMNEGTHEIQVRCIDESGEAQATFIGSLMVQPILLEGKIEYREGE